MADQVLEALKEFHPLPWGTVLDAGTGQSSLEWLCGLDCAAWTAVTAEAGRAEGLRRRLGSRFRPQDRLLLGNWNDPVLLAQETFSVVVADYLLGSLERYAPGFQRDLLGRLVGLTGEVLFLVGLEPYRRPPSSESESWVLELRDLRDACQILTSRRPHLEYPLEWVLEQLEGLGLPAVQVERFRNLYGADFVEAELAGVETTVARLTDPGLRRTLTSRIRALRTRGLGLVDRLGHLEASFDYLVVARRG